MAKRAKPLPVRYHPARLPLGMEPAAFEDTMRRALAIPADEARAIVERTSTSKRHKRR